MMAMGLLGLIVSAAIGQVKVGPPDNRRLFTSVGAGGIASLVILVVSGGLQAAEVWGGGWGVWIVSTGIACTVTLWISYDTELLAHKMEKSEWSQCIVFFMTDLALLFLFCCLICCCR